MGVGQVPWSAVVRYAEVVGYSDWEKLYAVVAIVDARLRELERNAKDGR